MRRTIKIFLAIIGLAILGLPAWAFSLLGPTISGSPDGYQTGSLGYNLGSFDVGAPKMLGQGYRRNVGTIYYGFDKNFVTFFQPNGMNAVRSAFNVMNAVTNADNIQLSQYPFNTQQSFDARALNLSDLKSWTLGLIVEQMGLAQSIRYDWTLHDRFLPAGAQCSANPAINGEEYLVTQRNLDPVSQVYSSYVNNVLYSFELLESCGKLGVPPDLINGITVDALASPVPVDVNAEPFIPVSETPDVWIEPLLTGNYYTGLTYDDAGGLKYLYSTNNIALEDPSAGSGAALEVTNTQFQLLQTSDLGALFSFASTNPPAAVLAQFPGIVIDSFSTFFTVVSNPIVVSYFTNLPGSPIATFVVKTNGYFFTAQTNFVYQFDNIVIVNEHTNTSAQIQTIALSVQNGAPNGADVITNVTYKKITLSNTISGDFYILPPNSCGFNFVKTLLKNNRAGITTNVITTSTNPATGFVGSESLITYFTNNWYEYLACTFQTSGPAVYQGIGKVNFVEADFDPTLGQSSGPVTNFYTMMVLTATNGRPVMQRFRRIITQPDILIDASDEASPNAAEIGVGFPPISRTMTYLLDPQTPGSVSQSGPGTIVNYPTTFVYDDVGSIIPVSGSQVNAQNAFLTTTASLLTWGSFDNSTNPPIIYPNGNLSNLVNQVLVQISPSVLPDATNTVPYSQTFTVSGGSFVPSYSWSLGTDPTTLQTTVLPAGLTLSSDGTISGTPLGNPVGTYDFIIQMTDSNGRSVTWNYSINIDQ